MAHFKYTAITPAGARSEGLVEAASDAKARRDLNDSGNIPLTVNRISKKDALSLLSGRATPPMNTRELILFSKQLATMIEGGVSYLRAIKTLGEQADKPVVKAICESIERSLSKGETLSAAFEKHPQSFNSVYLGMIQAGEDSGQLPAVLVRLVKMIEDNKKIRDEIVSAFTYPCVVLSFLFFAFIVLVTFVVPQISGVLTKSNMEIPLPTLICMKLNVWITGYWYIFIAGALASFFSLRSYLSTTIGKYQRDKVFLNIPYLGKVIRDGALARFCSILAIFHASGVLLHDSLTRLRETVGNRVLEREILQVAARISEGETVANALGKSIYFPRLLVNMVEVGESSGSLSKVLEDTGKHFEDEMKMSIKLMMGIVSPLLTVILLFMVLFFALAIYLPLWDLGKAGL